MRLLTYGRKEVEEEQEGEWRKGKRKKEVTMFSCQLQSMVQSEASADVSNFCSLVESIHPFTCIPVVSPHTKGRLHDTIFH